MIIYARGLYDRVAPSTNYYCFNKLPLFYNSYFEAFVIKMIKKSRRTNSRILKFTISGFLVMNFDKIDCLANFFCIFFSALPFLKAVLYSLLFSLSFSLIAVFVLAIVDRVNVSFKGTDWTKIPLMLPPRNHGRSREDLLAVVRC